MHAHDWIEWVLNFFQTVALMWFWLAGAECSNIIGTDDWVPNIGRLWAMQIYCSFVSLEQSRPDLDLENFLGFSRTRSRPFSWPFAASEGKKTFEGGSGENWRWINCQNQHRWFSNNEGQIESSNWRSLMTPSQPSMARRSKWKILRAAVCAHSDVFRCRIPCIDAGGADHRFPVQRQSLLNFFFGIWRWTCWSWWVYLLVKQIKSIPFLICLRCPRWIPAKSAVHMSSCANKRWLSLEAVFFVR